MHEDKPDFSEWAPLTNDELLERMQRNESDLLEILLRWGDPNKNKYKNPHKLLAEQYTRLAEHHRDLMEVRTPEDD
jgi:hypothetical protein